MADPIAEAIARVRELDAAATKGPWVRGIGNEYRLVRRGLAETVAADCGADNGNLIAFYRTAAPALADECERLRERVSVLEEALRPFQFRDTHFIGCRRAGFGGEPHNDHDWSNGREPATACSDHCWAARAALEGK